MTEALAGVDDDKGFPPTGDDAEASCGLLESRLEVDHMDTITVVIRRGKTGYGFTVTGSAPVTIRRVEEGSPACQSGLRVGDAVIRINGQNVSRSIADSVAKIIRLSEKQIILDVQRSVSYRTQKQHNPEIQKQSLATICEHEAGGIPERNRIVCKADVEAPPSTSSDDSSMDLSHDSSSSRDSSQSSSRDSSHDQLIQLGDWESPRLENGARTPIRIRYDELPADDQERQSAIQNLLRCEEAFVDAMLFAIGRYVNPLRHKLISPAEHGTLFQNIDKLVSLSEYHVYKMKEEGMRYSEVKDRVEIYLDSVGGVYLQKLLMMSDIFEQYCNGIKNSFRLLAELKSYEEFNEFLQNPPLDPGQLTISGFIQKPLEHIKNLVLNLQEILSLTSLDHQDMENLSQVIETLRYTCNRINENNTRRSQNMTSLVSRSSRRSSKSTSSRSSEQSAAYTILSDSSGNSIESSVDTEVLDIQRRLVFCEHIQAFQLATATRHMIYSGELMHVDGLLCTKLCAFLMNDLLLLTREQPNNALLVVDYPILLQDIVVMDWPDNTTLDFVIAIESRANNPWVEPRTITLRAPSSEHKCTWKNILEQRIENCRLQDEMMMMRMDNFV